MKTKKCLIRIFVLFVLTFFCAVFTVNAQDFEIDSDGVLVSYNGPGGDVVIPNGVTAIGNYAFQYRGIKSVEIPMSVTSIGDYAFYNCWGLSSITIPESVMSIGYRAFYECGNLTSITILGNDTTMGGYAFESCRSLKNVTINGNIGYFAFAYCSNLESVMILDGVTSIGDDAFYDSGLMYITIPGNVTSIGQHAFQNCSSLMNVTIQEGVLSIGAYAFAGCDSLARLAIPSSVTLIGYLSIPFSTYDQDHSPYWYSQQDRTWYYPGNEYTSCDTIRERTGIADTYYAYDPFNTPNTTSITIKNFEGTVVNGDSMSCYEQNDCQLNASAIPEETIQSFYWISSDRNIAEVDRDGKVTFKKEGSVRVTAMAVDDSNISAWVDLTLRPKAETIEILNAAGEVITGQEINISEQSCQLSVQITPSNALQQVDWFRDNMIASVNSDNLVTFNTYGSITLTAKTKDGSRLSAWVKITYTSLKISGLDNTNITGKAVAIQTKDYQLKASADPIEAIQEFIWTSSDSSIAEVNSNGKVTFKKAGKVTIKAAANDDSRKFAKVTLIYVTDDNALILPLGLTEIQVSAFEGSKAFSSVDLPDGLTAIGSRAFANCSGLMLVYIPDSVRSIGDNVFENDPDVVLVCQSDNTGADYASSHNIAYQIGY